MSADTSTIIIVLTIIGTGAALALAILPGLRDLRRELHTLGERVSRLESAVEGLLRLNIGDRLARIESAVEGLQRLNIGDRLTRIEAHLGLNGSRFGAGEVQTREEK